MALSADEQRALAEIERRLATDDPGLATCMTAFRRPGPGRVLRSPRARIIGSLFTVLLVAMVSLMVYAMIPFRSHVARPAPSASVQDNVSIAASGASGTPHSSPPASANASARSGATTAASARPAAGSATPSAGFSTGNTWTQSSTGQATGQVASSPPGPQPASDR